MNGNVIWKDAKAEYEKFIVKILCQILIIFTARRLVCIVPLLIGLMCSCQEKRILIQKFRLRKYVNGRTRKGCWKRRCWLLVVKKSWHILAYSLQGVSPSPRIDMKFDSHANDPVNGNDLCHRVFGGKSKGVVRHRLFKRYFAACDPVTPTPDPKVSPNWKVEKLIKQIIYI